MSASDSIGNEASSPSGVKRFLLGANSKLSRKNATERISRGIERRHSKEIHAVGTKALKQLPPQTIENMTKEQLQSLRFKHLSRWNIDQIEAAVPKLTSDQIEQLLSSKCLLGRDVMQRVGRLLTEIQRRDLLRAFPEVAYSETADLIDQNRMGFMRAYQDYRRKLIVAITSDHATGPERVGHMLMVVNLKQRVALASYVKEEEYAYTISQLESKEAYDSIKSMGQKKKEKILEHLAEKDKLRLQNIEDELTRNIT